MNCPECDSVRFNVISTECREDQNVEYRIRKCLSCGHTAPTYEILDGERWKQFNRYVALKGNLWKY